MKKPAYMSDLVAFVFLGLGIFFFFWGVLAFVEVMPIKPNSSIQDPQLLGWSFIIMGWVFCAIQWILLIVSHRKKTQRKRLIASGIAVSGCVERVYLQSMTHWGNQSPYRIYYSYTHKGELYQGKSCLLWNEPTCKAGDSIQVFVDDAGHSTLGDVSACNQ